MTTLDYIIINLERDKQLKIDLSKNGDSIERYILKSGYVDTVMTARNIAFLQLKEYGITLKHQKNIEMVNSTSRVPVRLDNLKIDINESKNLDRISLCYNNNTIKLSNFINIITTLYDKDVIGLPEAPSNVYYINDFFDNIETVSLQLYPNTYNSSCMLNIFRQSKNSIKDIW